MSSSVFTEYDCVTNDLCHGNNNKKKQELKLMHKTAKNKYLKFICYLVLSDGTEPQQMQESHSHLVSFFTKLYN